MSKPPVIILEGTSSAGKTTLCDNLVKLAANAKWEVDGLDILSKELGSPPQAFQKILNANPTSKQAYDQLMTGVGKDKFANGVIDKSVFEGRLKDGVEYSAEERTAIQQLIDNHSKQFKEAVPTFERRMEMLCERALDRSKRGVATILDVFPPADTDRGTDIVASFKKHWPDKDAPPLLTVGAHCDLDKITAHMDMRNSSENKDEARKTFGPFRQYGAMFVATDQASVAAGSLTVAEIEKAAEKFGNSNDKEKLLSSLGIAGDIAKDEVIRIAPRQPERYDLIVQTDTPRGEKSTKDVSLESAKLIQKTISLRNAAQEVLKDADIFRSLSNLESSNAENKNIPSVKSTDKNKDEGR